MGWNSLLGLQFENLILNRIPEIVKGLDLGNETIEAAGPFRQSVTTRTKGVQVDLLLRARSDTFYVCEIKFRREIDESVIKEVARKIADLKFPKRTSVRPVLIYAGQLDPSVEAAEYFDRILNVEQLLMR